MMSHTPELSIVVPVYNVESYLSQCIESVVNEAPAGDIEIILVNDGSKDGSPEICRAYESRYVNIKYVTQDNKGLSAARNTGIRHARGNYILFLDSDDYIKAGTLCRVIEDIKSCDVDFFFGRAYKCCDGRLELSQTDYGKFGGLSPAESFLRLNRDNGFWFAAWLVIIKREFLLENNLFFKDGILHEDELWVPSVFIKARSFKLLDYGFYCYRVNREGSIVSRPNVKREFDKLVVVSELTKLLGDGRSEDEIVFCRRASLVFGVLLALGKYRSHDDYEALKKSLSSRLGLMRHGKYVPVYYMVKVLGIDCVTKLLSIV